VRLSQAICGIAGFSLYITAARGNSDKKFK
jgi:hypothetical protein